MIAGGGSLREHILSIRGRILIGPLLLTGAVEVLLCLRLWSQISGYTAPTWVFTMTRPLVAPFPNPGAMQGEPKAAAFEFATLLAFEVYLLAFIALMIILYTLPAVIRLYNLVSTLRATSTQARSTIPEGRLQRFMERQLSLALGGDELEPLPQDEPQVGESPVLPR